MRTTALLAAALTVCGAFAAPARAADPALVAAFERVLREDEKSILAALLTNRDFNAEFDADARFASQDAASLKLVLDKWRNRMAIYADRDKTSAYPDLEGTYRTYPEMLSPEIRAYLARRLRGMQERGRTDPKVQKDFESLRDYLKSVQDALDSNGGKLTWYTKKVVAGIVDKYHEDLTDYLTTDFAKLARRSGPAAEREIARVREESAAAERQRQAASQPAKPGAVAGKPPLDEQPAQPPVVAAQPPKPGPGERAGAMPAEDARRQAENALPGSEAEARERGGRVFDGGAGTDPDAPVVVPGPGDGKPGTGGLDLTPAPGPGGVPNLAGSVPQVGDDNVLLDSIKGAKGYSDKSWVQHLPTIAGGVVGAGIGFLLGGPVGAIVGGLLGLIIGAVAGKLFLK